MFLIFLCAVQKQPEAEKPPEADTKKLTDTNILSMVQGQEQYWYDIFLHLGFSHEQLAECKRKYSLYPREAMKQMIPRWLAGEALEPSWEALVLVLRYKLLEEDAAANIEKKYGVPEEPATEYKSMYVPSLISTGP